MVSTDVDVRPPLQPNEDLLGIVGGGLLIGYARVSTRDQNLDRQIDALTSVGCSRIFKESLSGKNADRPELWKCFDYARAGDTIAVLELWRLGRNLQDLLSLVGDLRRRGIGFKSLHENLDTTTPGGRLIFHVFAALGEFIREMIVQGTNEGLDAARARGVRLGRPPAMTPEQVDAARQLLPDNSITAIAKLLGVSRSTIYKYVPELKPALAPVPSQPALPLEQASVRAPLPMPTAPVSSKPDELECPSCMQRPKYKRERELFEDALGTVWLVAYPGRPGEVATRWYCDRCQPHGAELVLCRCGKDAGVMISSSLAGQADDSTSLVGQWLTDHGWIHHESTWYCARHQRRHMT
jgi:DNA invertase Pin-like site-specific DNA recombinase